MTEKKEPETDGTPLTDHVYDGIQEYESLGWLSGHEVRYTIPPGVRVLGLMYRETGYDADFDGAFRSDDPSLDVLWAKARRTLYVNMRDNHMDCPDRERAQWYGDMTVQQEQVFYALDAERGPLLLRLQYFHLPARNPCPRGKNAGFFQATA
jgi:alpha-L-rhamnosidase